MNAHHRLWARGSVALSEHTDGHTHDYWRQRQTYSGRYNHESGRPKRNRDNGQVRKAKQS